MNKLIKISRLMVVVVAIILSGCTMMLFEPHSYTEDISSVLISADNKNVVVFTDKYHYVFDANPVLVNTINSSFAKNSYIEFGWFNVSGVGVTTGEILISLGLNAKELDNSEALKAGYAIGPSGNVYAKIKLNGMRYMSNGIQPPNLQKLNKTYAVNVSAEQTRGEKAAKYLLTPITVAADGILLIATVPLLIVLGTAGSLMLCPTGPGPSCH